MVGCATFRSGTPLAEEQDRDIAMIKEGKELPCYEFDALDNNLWVAMAYRMAPSNLVIRQYCLVDYLRGVPLHRDRIERMMAALTYEGYRDTAGLIWAEGYSYFLYTRMALDLWVKQFDVSSMRIQETIKRVELGFKLTSYRGKDRLLYPAPFGDLRFEPLAVQDSGHAVRACTVGPVDLMVVNDTVRYFMQGRPVGLNLHIPKKSYSVLVWGGVMTGYRFYEGYKKKYPSFWDELKDMIGRPITY